MQFGLEQTREFPDGCCRPGGLSDSYDKDQGTGLRRLHTAEPLARPISAPGLGLCLLLITLSISILIGTNCEPACRGPWEASPCGLLHGGTVVWFPCHVSLVNWNICPITQPFTSAQKLIPAM